MTRAEPVANTELKRAALTDERLATALHEAAHAVAYLCLGRTFKYLSVKEAQIVGNGKFIDVVDQARISLAGPVAESFMMNQGAADDVIYRWIIERRNDVLEHDDDADDNPNDFILAGDYGVPLLPMVLALTEIFWAQVEIIAKEALLVDPLLYGAVRKLLGELPASEQFHVLMDKWVSIANIAEIEMTATEIDA